jgi:hypothetical protein
MLNPFFGTMELAIDIYTLVASAILFVSSPFVYLTSPSTLAIIVNK